MRALPAWLCRWMLSLLLGPMGLGLALAQPHPATVSASASDQQAREQLLAQLREAKNQLSQLENNIRDIENRLAPAVPASAALTATPATGVPVHWLWLGVLTIVILMIGITYSGRSKKQPKAMHATSVQHPDLAQFQSRLGGLDLNLDLPLAKPPTERP